MKISLSWLRTLIATEHSPQQIAEILTNTGLEIEHLEEVETLPGGLEGLLIGEVLETSAHPNADKLSLCRVHTGKGEIVQIVCGASNVASGQKVVVAPVGSSIHPTVGSPFSIKQAKIRGELSMGMICAEDEIGLGTDHSGILVLDPEAVVGSDAASYFGIQSDHVFEIGLTPNRGDAISHWGVARDLHAVTAGRLILPGLSDNISDKPSLTVEVVNPGQCPRYAGMRVDNIRIDESPNWLKNRLRSIGLKPINNVVDITNFVMHELGQPLHAFDAGHISGGVTVRNAREGEKLITLDGIERIFSGGELVIADREVILALAGVLGGLHSGVTYTTESIFIESATFQPGVVRHSARRFGLNTDASFRFERGTDPELPVLALKRMLYLLEQVCGAVQPSQITDVYPEPIQPVQIDLDPVWLNRFCGVDAGRDKIREILERLDIEVNEEGERFRLLIPSYRVDVRRPVDVAEEFLRIWGYDNVPIPDKLRLSAATQKEFDEPALRNKLSDGLSSMGFLEIMNNSQTRLENTGDDRVVLLNPLSQEYNAMRSSMLPGLLDAISYNRKRKQDSLMFFEFGKTYHLRSGKYEEDDLLILGGCGRLRENNWMDDGGHIDYYYVKSIVHWLWKRSGIEGAPDAGTVEFGHADAALLRRLDIEDVVPYAVIKWKAWVRKARKSKFILEEVPRFPVVRRDISAVLERSVRFEQVSEIVRRESGRYFRGVNCFDVYQGENLEADSKAYAFSVYWYDEEKTMHDKQIDRLLQQCITALERDLKARIRR